MSYVYLKGGNGDPYTVGYYSSNGQWQPESDHDSAEDAARRVRFLNGGDVETVGQERWHLSASPGIRVCGNDEPNSASTDKISNVTCLECLRLKALALPQVGMSIPEAIQKIRKAESLKDRHRSWCESVIDIDELQPIRKKILASL